MDPGIYLDIKELRYPMQDHAPHWNGSYLRYKQIQHLTWLSVGQS